MKKPFVNPIPYIEKGKEFELRVRVKFDEVVELDEAKNAAAEFIKSMSKDELAKALACLKIAPVYPEV